MSSHDIRQTLRLQLGDRKKRFQVLHGVFDTLELIRAKVQREQGVTLEEWLKEDIDSLHRQEIADEPVELDDHSRFKSFERG